MSTKDRGLSRRKFIGDVAAISAFAAPAAGVILSSCSREVKYEAPVFPDKAPDGRLLKAGLVGCGGRGTGAALNFLEAGPNLELVALGDLFEDRLDTCRKSLKERTGVDIPDQNCFTGFDSYKKVIDLDIDIVLLCQPPHFRPQSLKYAIENRKHVFAEKPVAVDPSGIRSVMATGRRAEEMGLMILAGTHYRHMDDRVKAHEMVKNGAIGDIISVNCYYNTGKLWHRNKQEGWTEMEAMIRDWGNWKWLSGDHIVEQHIHELDTAHWFMEKEPVSALAFGGRHRRLTGDQYDFFSVDFEYDDGRHMHSMSRQIPGCANRTQTILFHGTKGYTNGLNKIWDYKGNVIWEYQYPADKNGKPSDKLAVVPHQQEIINMVTALRRNEYINDIKNVSGANLVAIMGRESAYTGQLITRDELINSDMRLGPTEYNFGPVDIPVEIPVPGLDPYVEPHRLDKVLNSI